MDIETVVIIVSVICFTLSIYLAILSTQVIDIRLRIQLVNWALCSLIGGIIILACWLISQAIKRAFFKEERLTIRW